MTAVDSTPTVSLRADTLGVIAQRMPVPSYDRSVVRTGIVHIGVGGFHRAHQAMYLDELMNEGRALDWGITGVGIMPADHRMAEVMAAQDGLYTLVVKHPDGVDELRVIGSIVEYLFAPEEGEEVLARMSDPATRIVSLTITEGGYAVGVDDETDETPGEPADRRPPSAAGLIVDALAHRRAAGTAPFTVMSCDNIRDNGRVARAMVVAVARQRDPELAEWIETEVAFPSSMVDRITPTTTDDDRRRVEERTGVVDVWPVVCEPFTQWALEDDFPAGRPPLAESGVLLGDDVEPYELMKLRLLNAGHQTIAYLGVLAGYTYVHEACADADIVGLLLGYMAEEAGPTLPEVPGIDLEVYRGQLIERFANPEVRDTLARLCVDGSDRIPTWLVPVIRERLDVGGQVDRAALVVASWARYAEGADEDGRPLDVVDSRRDRLMAAAARHAEDDLAFLRDEDLFADLADRPGFVEPYRRALRMLHEQGAAATVRAWGK